MVHIVVCNIWWLIFVVKTVFAFDFHLRFCLLGLLKDNHQDNYIPWNVEHEFATTRCVDLRRLAMLSLIVIYWISVD